MSRSAIGCLLLLLVAGCSVAPDRPRPEAFLTSPAAAPVELTATTRSYSFYGRATGHINQGAQESASEQDAARAVPQEIGENAQVPIDEESSQQSVAPEVPTEVATSETGATHDPAPDAVGESAGNPDTQPVIDDRPAVAPEALAPEYAAPATEPAPGPEHAATQTRQPEPEAAPQAEPQADVMDLDGLETRLRKTKAIGLFTKLELKSQVNDLLEDVEDYHQSRNSLSLSQLEEHFNLLVMKLLVLLEGEDPQLHHDIAQARPALWTTLADPDHFSSIKGP